LTNQEKGANTESIELSKTQLNFLEFCKQYGWGKIEVKIKNGEPCMSREIEHDYKHD